MYKTNTKMGSPPHPPPPPLANLDNAYIHATHGKRRIKGREVAIIAVLDGGPNEGNQKKNGFSTPSCYDFGECDTASVHLLYNQKFLASTNSIPNLGGGGGGAKGG